jgi:guanylate kinase
VSAASAKPGIPFVVAAPSGTGKTTVCGKLVERDGQISFSVSHTTRTQREGEVDGGDYFFVEKKEFQRLIEEEAFLEWAVYNSNHYGTSWKAIEQPLRQGRDMLLEIEVQGAAQVRERRPDACLIFLLPPSMQALEQRLRERRTDSNEQIQRRLETAERELEAIAEFDYAVTNDDLDVCVTNLVEIIRAERNGAPGNLRDRFSPSRARERFAGERVEKA